MTKAEKLERSLNSRQFRELIAQCERDGRRILFVEYVTPGSFFVGLSEPALTQPPLFTAPTNVEPSKSNKPHPSCRPSPRPTTPAIQSPHAAKPSRDSAQHANPT